MKIWIGMLMSIWGLNVGHRLFLEIGIIFWELVKINVIFQGPLKIFCYSFGVIKKHYALLNQIFVSTNCVNAK